jgi:RHS repeat-associated protein
LASTTNGWSFGYDANGNMTTRNVRTTYTYGYDVENRLTKVSGGTTASFVYDADGVRVRGTSGGVTTRYIGNYYEWTSAGSTSYYYAGSTRVAQRRVNYGSNNGLFWLTGDHLGSTSVTANSSGTKTAELRYKAWGETRYTSGTTLTTFKYTGQREESSFGLYYYGARWYDPYLNRWAQPDSIVPESSQGTQAWDRFAYSNNNPVTYKDPSGHSVDGNGDPYQPTDAPTYPSSGSNACQTSNGYAPGCGGPNDPAKEIQTRKSNGDYAGAIQAAVDIYGLKTNANIVYDYNNTLLPGEEGEFERNGTIIIGKSALFTDTGESKSTGFLAATIAHEEVHLDQSERGQSYYNVKPDDSSLPTEYQSQVRNMNEFEAYRTTVYNADNYRLSTSEVMEFERRGSGYYYQLSPENRTKALDGDYGLVGEGR